LRQQTGCHISRSRQVLRRNDVKNRSALGIARLPQFESFNHQSARAYALETGFLPLFQERRTGGEGDNMIKKILSGGQTGVDRAALDFAIDAGIPHGGFCPKGRKSENGRIPDRYNLTDTDSDGYKQRTRKNVFSSNGTLIISRGLLSGGTLKTRKICDVFGKTRHVVNTKAPIDSAEFVKWVYDHKIETLNVAGPREEKQGGIGKETIRVMTVLFEHLRAAEAAQAKHADTKSERKIEHRHGRKQPAVHRGTADEMAIFRRAVNGR
jgi:hypothetical protein